MSEKQHIQEYVPMQIIPPARLTPEMIEQIRAVVREEVRVMRPVLLSWEQVNELEEYIKVRICVICRHISMITLIAASAFAGCDLSAGYALCRCETEESTYTLVKNTELVSGTIIKNYELTDLGKSIIEDMQKSDRYNTRGRIE